MENVEVRIRMIGDFRKWEEIPVALIFKNNNIVGVRAVLDPYMNRETVKEIRLNYHGSQQGFYIE